MNARGVTILEVLAATVLLATTTIACIGLVRDARSTFTTSPASDSSHAVRLRWLAGVIAESPPTFGIDIEAAGPRVRTGRLNVDETLPSWCSQVTWKLSAPQSDEVAHAWLALAHGGVSVWTTVILIPSGIDEATR